MRPRAREGRRSIGMIPNTRDMKIGAVAGAGGTVAADMTVGLERATAAAGDVLRGIFGGLPWDLSPQSIIEAVGGGGGETASMVLDIGVTLL